MPVSLIPQTLEVQASTTPNPPPYKAAKSGPFTGRLPFQGVVTVGSCMQFSVEGFAATVDFMRRYLSRRQHASNAHTR